MSIINKIVGSFDYCNKQKQRKKERKKEKENCVCFVLKTGTGKQNTISKNRKCSKPQTIFLKPV